MVTSIISTVSSYCVVYVRERERERERGDSKWIIFYFKGLTLFRIMFLIVYYSNSWLGIGILSYYTFCGFCVAQSLAFCVVFCRSVFVLFYFFVWPLYYLSCFLQQHIFIFLNSLYQSCVIYTFRNH